jgi:transposase, IS5 family
MSRPREKRETGEQDLCRSRLDQIINMKHELVRLAQAIDWPVLEKRFAAVYSDGPGMPPLPTRLMAGLAILKHTFDLSDEVLCVRWVENPYFQYLCGEEFFCHTALRPLVDDALARSHGRGADRGLAAGKPQHCGQVGAMKPQDTRQVIVDTTVQPKNVMFPTDAKLIHRARQRLVRLAGKARLKLRQSYVRVGKLALIKHQRYAHAKQFKRANKALRTLKTYLGRTIRDISRQIAGEEALEAIQMASLPGIGGS